MSILKTNNGSIREIQDEIIEEFKMLDDWTERYKYIIELGQEAPPLPEELKTDDRKIKGCQSNVWLHTYLNNDKTIFEGDSDAMITRGLINLLIRVYTNQHPADILNEDLFFINEINMREHLSPTRANGLGLIVKKMRLYAMAFKTKLERD